MRHLVLTSAAALATVLAACEERSDTASARVNAMEIHADAFGSARAEVRENLIRVTRIEGPRTAAGVAFTLGPRAPNGRFAAMFQTRSDGRVSLRTRTNGEVQYASGQGGAFYIGDDVDEILIYSDDASTIEIELSGLVNCRQTNEGPCFTTEDLRREIFPNGEPEGRHEHLLALLHWASNAADQASDQAVHALSRRLGGHSSAAIMYSTIYRPDIGGGYCGAHSVFFAKVLRSFGYDPVLINYGILENDLTHVSVLVYNPFGDGRFYLLDPTFNAHVLYRDSGAWAPFDEILHRPPGAFEIVTASLDDRDFLFAPETIPAPAYTDCSATAAGDIVSCSRPGYGIGDYYESFGPALRAAGYPATNEGFLLLLRSHYFSAGNGASDEARAAFQGLLARHGITLETNRGT